MHILGKHCLSFCAVVLLTCAAHGQCPSWRTGFEVPGTNALLSGGLAPRVGALRVLDDGTEGGPSLFVGGSFWTTGDITSPLVARWRGGEWSAIGGNPGIASYNPVILDVALFDDGSGESLYACGSFYPPEGGFVGAYGIARWDGSAWHDVGVYDPAIPGTGSFIGELAVFDDGSGAALYGATSRGVLKWNGSVWSNIGSTNAGGVYTLLVHDDGGGPSLFAGGGFKTIGGVSANRVAKWNGSNWSALGAGVTNSADNAWVYSLATFDDGTGARLAVGGVFAGSAGSVPVLSRDVILWDGSAWIALDLGIGDPNTYKGVRALASYDDGDGVALYAGGDFDDAVLGTHYLARWNGAHWSSVGTGVEGAVDPAGYVSVNALAVYDDGTGHGAALFVGGNFTIAGGVAAHQVARFDGGGFSPLVHPANGLSDMPLVFRVADDPAGCGERLFAGGRFLTAGATAARRVAQWDGQAWSSLGAGIGGDVLAFETYRSASEPTANLYAGGQFAEAGGGAIANVARWNGASWSPLGSGITQANFPGPNVPIVRALCAYDSGNGPELYAGGSFLKAGGAPAANIARWNGTSWNNAGSVSSELSFASGVICMIVFDDGTGGALYVGGVFQQAGDPSGVKTVNNVARWNGTSYSALGAGLNGGVYSFAIFDDGSGPALFANGGFGVHRWNGAAWISAGPGNVGGPLVVFDSGNGKELCGQSSGGFVRWTGGTTWVPLIAGGLQRINFEQQVVQNAGAQCMAAFRPSASDAESLCVGGMFDYAGGHVAHDFAAIDPCSTPPGTPFCFGDGSLATPCPCASPDVVPSPPAAIGHGCANSFDLDGAQLLAHGSTTSDDVVLTTSGQSPAGFSFFFVGTAEVTNGIAIQDGVRCAGGALTRFGSQSAACGSVKYPNPDVGWTSPLSTVSGTTPGSGLAKYYQVLYRNAAAGFCSAGTANLTSGYRIVW
ncbi:MAG: hypothetical protein ACKVWV_05955 [Planctomycetota bacterium]